MDEIAYNPVVTKLFLRYIYGLLAMFFFRNDQIIIVFIV